MKKILGIVLVLVFSFVGSVSANGGGWPECKSEPGDVKTFYSCLLDYTEQDIHSYWSFTLSKSIPTWEVSIFFWEDNIEYLTNSNIHEQICNIKLEDKEKFIGKGLR